jgi:hypothetical protein
LLMQLLECNSQKWLRPDSNPRETRGRPIVNLIFVVARASTSVATAADFTIKLIKIFP